MIIENYSKKHMVSPQRALNGRDQKKCLPAPFMNGNHLNGDPTTTSDKSRPNADLAHTVHGIHVNGKSGTTSYGSNLNGESTTMTNGCHTNGKSAPIGNGSHLNGDSAATANGVEPNGKSVTTLNGNHLNGSLASASYDPPETRLIYTLSAPDKDSAKAQMVNLATYIADHPQSGDIDWLQDMAFTLSMRRSLFDWRVAIPASSGAELVEALRDASLEPSKTSGKPRLAFVFTGQGSQWYAMGRELMAYAVFAETMHTADRCIKDLGARWSLLGMIGIIFSCS